ncbi:LOW QUALITY PROTEIN: rho family-interacting cell polarization regulator 1-like [Salarias fasciatus]|uniref:LOW QUALITY PROTEIN: rho family-interacting cell polarization regulator 1-like n=1 Tax=Salarias fasciatus TaxID=181472 RepID=UPI001176F217|nr:LOW QUALITY PROTEIN: rho family-interacting cell polarization regulator 1-like [Salarias fasciatus]
MYSGYGGSPSRTLSTMSLSVRPVRRLTSRSITRSQSFTGVNTYDKAYRSLSVFSTPGLSRKPSRASRMFTASTKANPPPKVPQPERLDQVYDALKTGLQSHLQVHQMDLDSLTRQMKESKRNSRLGFLYEVDKQVKVTERYIRRLEFHLSKIEELYEAYCLQRRLRDGADKMVKAYTASPGSKEARESLAEANKGYKEYTENMCVLESEFENQLGEFHIRMKGLAGFARLCAGDQYEILMKYGRQRWKLRGRIEINAKQVWDSEEMVFLPLISDFLCVKVTELKSLANHVVVGNVSCETKDLFAALPQTVAVDINDLGTIKLSLEVTWNPFDKDDQGSVTSTVNKAPSVSKRFSTIFNQSPPDTPSLREQAFFNMLRRREELENGAAWSNSSESSDDSSPQLPAQGPRNSTRPTGVLVTSDLQPAVTGSSSSNSDVSFGCRDASFSPQNSSQHRDGVPELPDAAKLPPLTRDEECTAATTVEAGGEDSTEKRPVSVAEDPVTPGNGACRYARSLSHISESSADGAAPTDRSAGESADATSPISRISISDIEMELRGRTQEPPGAADSERSEAGGDGVAETLPSETNGEDGTYVARRVSVEEEAGGGGLEDPSRAACGVPDSGLEDALGAVVSSLDDYRGQFPELQLLEQELKLLQATLKGGSHSRSPSVFSLTVETALGSFDFLNTSDCEEEEEEEEERGGRRSRGGRSLQDRGFSPPSSPLTTGCSTLDGVLVVHLKNCGAQLLRLGTFGPLRCGEMYALDKLLREARVLEVVRRLIKENPRRRRQPAEVIPQLGQTPGAASLWQQCVGKQGSVYSTTADTLLLTLASAYATVLPSPAEPVCVCLVERLLDQRLPRRGNSRSEVTVTLFQLWSYLEANGVGDMDTHVTELAEEVRLVETLSSCDQDLIVQALRRPPECSLRREGLHAVARLLRDPRGKVSASASSVLRSLAAQPRQRERALVGCLELLEQSDVEARVCGCKALASLKAKESIDQLVYLCQTDKEEVRDAAKQTLLVLGEEGKMAHRHVETSQDSLPRLFAPGSMASTAF